MSTGMRIRRLVRVVVVWLVLALIPFLTLIFLPDYPVDVTLPQDQVLFWNGLWAPQDKRRQWEDVFSTIHWDVELPIPEIAGSIGTLILNEQRIPLTQGAHAMVELQQRDIWTRSRPIMQLCEIGGLVPESDSRMMYAYLLNAYKWDSGRHNIIVPVTLSKAYEGRWTVNRIDDTGIYPLLDFELPTLGNSIDKPLVHSAAGWATTPYWKARIGLGIWLYLAIVVPIILFSTGYSTFYFIFMLGVVVFNFLLTLIKVALGVFLVCAGLFGLWVLWEGRQTGGDTSSNATTVAAAATDAPAPSASPAPVSQQAEQTVIFEVDPKDLEEGLGGQYVPSDPTTKEEP